jgi:hypothetical protein
MSERGGIARPRWVAVLASFACLGSSAVAAPAREEACKFPFRYYGTYSVGTKAGSGKVPLADRLRELRGYGANMVIGVGEKTDILDLLPPGMLAVPGCGLLKKTDWQRDGRWDEAQARKRLATLAKRFANHPRVFGVCITHEVTEYADHARRHWMYRLAKEYFPEKKVIQYYGLLTDKENPQRKKVDGYGERGELETDILFVSLPVVAKGRFNVENVRRLRAALSAAARTPGIPVWGQTSINADNKIVTGPESMVSIWGARGENMAVWADTLAKTEGPKTEKGPLKLTGFFWRSLGRFPWDLGYPEFTAHRAQMKTIGAQRCGTS